MATGRVRIWPFNGYAPGNYMNTCTVCKTTMTGVDKLCFVCLSCAIKGANELFDYAELGELEFPDYKQMGGGKPWDEMNEAEQANYNLNKALNAVLIARNTVKRLRKQLTDLSPSTPLSVEEAAKAYADAKADSKWNKAAELERAFISGSVHRESREVKYFLWAVNLYNALCELVELKDLKDTHGKTEVYNVRQPTAWDVARRLTKEFKADNNYPTSTPIPSDIVEKLEKANPWKDGIEDKPGYILDKIDGYETAVRELQEILKPK